jgi:hypothetical protein
VPNQLRHQTRRTAGIDAHVYVAVDRLCPTIESVLGWAMREGLASRTLNAGSAVSDVLRHHLAEREGFRVWARSRPIRCHFASGEDRYTVTSTVTGLPRAQRRRTQRACPVRRATFVLPAAERERVGVAPAVVARDRARFALPTRIA